MFGFLNIFKKRKNVRVLCQGLDAAGKTTMLYRLKLGEVVTTIPTIGFNVETVQHKYFMFTVWDIGGRDKIRPLWRHYYVNTDGLIFMIDSNDKERFEDAKREMKATILEEELKNLPVLVFANKQDLPGAMSPSKLSEEFDFATIFKGRKWLVIGSCATSGDGLIDGLEWLSNTIHPKEDTKEEVFDIDHSFTTGLFEKATNYLSRLIYKPATIHGETST